jgi:hypothetical protein
LSHDVPLSWQTVLGSFDSYTLEIKSIYSKHYTDKPLDLDSEDSIEAWTTMMHEWVHFMQFCSTTYGLLVTMNRLKQQSLFMGFCHTIAKLMKANGSVPVLFVPLRRALVQRVYPQFLHEAHKAFVRDWWTWEIKLLSNYGLWTNADKKSVSYTTLSPLLLGYLSQTRAYANEPLTVGHIVEPIAVGCQGQFLINECGIERATTEITRLFPRGLMYTMLPAVMRELGINPSTRLVLHDLALMLPIEHRASATPPTPERYSPTARLISALELIAIGKVHQVPDSEPNSYIRLASDLAKCLHWPEYPELISRALGLATELDTITGGDRVTRHLFDDFIRAFRVRLNRPDAFVCLTPASLHLYEEGWQPVWTQKEGWLSASRQSPLEAERRLLSSLSIQAVKTFVDGGSWECPRQEHCETTRQNKGAFPSGDADQIGCYCRLAVEMATGGVFRPEEIIVLK